VCGVRWLDVGAGALARNIEVVGVAKSAFAGAAAAEVLRGTSARPLYVTAVGTERAAAAAGVQSMHGDHRIPTLLGRVDALARGRVSPNSPY